MLIMAEMVRVNTRISSLLNEWLDNRSEKTGVPKSTLIFLALENYMREVETMDKMSEMKSMFEQMQKQAEK